MRSVPSIQNAVNAVFPKFLNGDEESQQAEYVKLSPAREDADRFLEPLPRAIAYYRRSMLSKGRLARFYEMGSNRPLYFTKDYKLTYSADDLPTHYAFKVSSRVDRLQAEYDQTTLTARVRAPPAGFEPATHGLGNRCSIP